MPAMAGKWPQEAGHSHGNDHVPLNEGEQLRAGGPDEAGKRQPELPPGQENGVHSASSTQEDAAGASNRIPTVSVHLPTDMSTPSKR